MKFKNSPMGIIIRTPKGYDAFVPNPMPPKIDWNNDLLVNMSKTDHILGVLSAEGAKLPNPHLLMRPFIAKEAVLSSKIEGTQATLGDILAHDVGVKIKSNYEDLIEVNNYISSLDYGISRLETLPLSLRLIREIHGILMKGKAHLTPGEFRVSQNWIGSPGCSLSNAKYIPPPPEEMIHCLRNFEIFLHDKSLPPLIHIALCHYQFEAIHPFLDGNGRIGRLLIILLMIEKKLLLSPMLYISAFFEATKIEYYSQLYSVSSTGNLNDWFLYFLNAIYTQSLDVLSRVRRINTLLTNWQIEVGKDTLAQNIIKQVAVNPYCSINKMKEKLKVSFTTSQRGIKKLETLGILKAVSNKKRDRVFYAEKILAILEEETKINQNIDC